jgi:hypothetical protein
VQHAASHMDESDMPREEEVWHFEEVVSSKMSSHLASLVVRELNLNEQERALEHVQNDELRQLVDECQCLVFAQIKEEFDVIPWVPESWEQTLYVRRKIMYENTRIHQDREFFLKRGYIDEGIELKSFVAFTWWIGLTPRAPRMSQLEFWGVEKGETSISVSMNTGDAVVFSSNMYHSASTHRRKQPRVSIDGRFLLRN